MVDAAIGGKVGVNHPLQKNLIGGFYQPRSVTICMDALRTLSERDMVAAFGEILKIAMVDGSDLFEKLETSSVDMRRNPDWLGNVVMHCIASKFRLLGDNCYERDLSRELNFGHSIAHPLEDETRFAVTHGEAVAIGIVVATQLAFDRALIDEMTRARVMDTVTRLGLPAKLPRRTIHSLEDHLHRLLLQRGGQSLHYVVPVAHNAVLVHDEITGDEVIRAAAIIGEETN